MATFEEVTCSVCLETFVDPVILDCGHNLCHRCALKIYNFPRLAALQTPKTRPTSTSPALLERPKNDPSLLCPLCQKGSRIDPGRGVDTLPRNVVLKKFLEELSSKSIPCNNCENALAVKDCLECKAPYCQECLAKTHLGKVFATHQMVPVGSLFRKNKRFCQIHADQLANLFCLHDKAFVCSYCALFTDEHKGHECVPEIKAVNVLKGEISAAATKMCEQEEALRRVRECATVAHTNNAAERKHLIREVDAAFQEALDKLAMRKGELVQEISSRMAFRDEVHVLQMQSSEMLLSRLAALQTAVKSDPSMQLKWLTDSSEFLMTAAEASPRWASPPQPTVVLEMKGLSDMIKCVGLVTTKEDLRRAEDEKRVGARRLEEAIKGLVPAGSLVDGPTAQRLLEKANVRGKRLQLLYRASADGFSNETFHGRCDNQGPTFTIAKSNTAVIFGGYTTVSWDSSSGWSADASAFLFRVNSSANVSFGEVLPNGCVNNAVRRNANFGPLFGSSNDLRLQLNDVKQSHAGGQGTYSHANFPQCSLVGSYNRWFPSEVEVFGLARLPSSSS